MNLTKILKILVSILICQNAGIIGSVFTSTTTDWYLSLQKPWFQPPGWLFAPIWIILYTLMGISLYLVWEKGLERKDVKVGLLFFGIQLILNSLWTFIFFGLQLSLYGLIEILILFIVVMATTIKFYKISRAAGILLIPYILWLIVAILLNYYIVILN